MALYKCCILLLLFFFFWRPIFTIENCLLNYWKLPSPFALIDVSLNSRARGDVAVSEVVPFNIFFYLILAGYPASLGTLSPPSLLLPLSPLLLVPAFYTPSLGLPGFAQDNCIPEILF